MRKIALLVVFFMLILAGMLVASGCDTFATCSDHGISGTQTGNVKYTPNGCMIAEYRHQADIMGKYPAHKYWQACDCK